MIVFLDLDHYLKSSNYYWITPTFFFFEYSQYDIPSALYSADHLRTAAETSYQSIHAWRALERNAITFPTFPSYLVTSVHAKIIL